MLEVTELREGAYFEEDGLPYQVLKYEHIKMGRGNATIRLRVKNLKNDSTVVKSFVSGKRVEEAILDKQRATFLFRTSTDFVFQTEQDEEQLEIPIDKIGDRSRFIKKNMEVSILTYEDEPLVVELPIKGTYTVKEAPPDARGNSANAGYKEVVLDTNARVKVPMFIKQGDELIIDTRTGQYVSRA